MRIKQVAKYIAKILLVAIVAWGKGISVAQNHNDKETEEQISQSIDLLSKTLGEDLIGVYLYGSAVTGGLKAFSDIDLFVVSNRSTTEEEKKILVDEFLKISGVYQKSQKRPIELLIVVKSQVSPWSYPPKFDFQYGDWLRNDFEKGNYSPWGSYEMPDLALLVTQLLLANKPLKGPPPEDILDEVPFKDVLSATKDSLDELNQGLDSDTRNVLLTFARMWAMLLTEKIHSKEQAATWAVKKLPDIHKRMVEKALAIYLDDEKEDWSDQMPSALACAAYLKDKVSERIRFYQTEDLSDRKLGLQK